MKTNLNKLALSASLIMGLGATTQAQTLLYSVNGTGGTGGGTSGVSVTPSTAPSGSSTLTDLASGDSSFSFGTGPDGVTGESILNAATGQAGSGVLAGTLGASSSLTQLTLTMWINQSAATINNYRILEIAPGSSATTSSADGTDLFFGENSGGGLQFYVNNVNGNSTATDIATANTWNGAAIAANTWYFVAVTYDTVGGNSFLYSGTQSSAASLQYTYANTSGGALNLSSATSISLLDRFSGGRNFPGAVDDVNLFSGILNASQLDSLQSSELIPVPEPATLTMVGVGFSSLIAVIRRRRS